jgi:DNA-binding LacI/PurR family transcriptional regulator
VVEGQPGVSIGSDNAQGGYEATRHLLAQGRQQIAWLGDASRHYPEFQARFRGYQKALREAQLTAMPSLRVTALSSESDGRTAMETLLNRGESFDAVFAASDLIAIGAMQVLAERGLRVPEDVAVVGFDDIPMARHARPALSTVAQDTRLAGQILVDTLIDQIHGKETPSQRLPVKLALRQSSGTTAN